MDIQINFNFKSFRLEAQTGTDDASSGTIFISEDQTRATSTFVIVRSL
jgi:hypothetical protein